MKNSKCCWIIRHGKDFTDGHIQAVARTKGLARRFIKSLKGYKYNERNDIYCNDVEGKWYTIKAEDFIYDDNTLARMVSLHSDSLDAYECESLDVSNKE